MVTLGKDVLGEDAYGPKFTMTGTVNWVVPRRHIGNLRRDIFIPRRRYCPKESRQRHIA